jgi:flagellar protein FlgJ
MADASVRAMAPNLDLLDPRQIKTLQRDAANGSPAALRSVAEQFEAILLTQMLKQMRKPMMPGGMFDTPEAQSWNEMVDQRMGLHLAKSGGIGLADALLKQIEFSNRGIAATGAQDSAQAGR